jgi:Inovirus Gp2
MRKNEKSDRLNNDFLKEFYYKKLYDSLFDPTKPQNSKLKYICYASILPILERFVDKVLLNNEIPFLPCVGTDGKKNYARSTLAHHYFKWIPGFIDVVNRLSPKYYYSEPINVFITCCHAMGLLNGGLDWRDFWVIDPDKTNPYLGGVSAAEIFNNLVQAIRNEWKVNKLQAKVNTRKLEVANQKVEYCNYADLLFSYWARLLLVRIDLFYEKHYGDSIDVFDMTNDLDRMLNNNARHNSLFAFMRGFIVKLEYGVEKGIHAHVLLFLDGSKRNNFSLIYLAEAIGEYWKNIITKGRGAYWNINANADHYNKLGRLGIGVINYNDDKLRSNLREFVVSYLCKEDQYFRPKWGQKVRLLRKGDSPQIAVTRPGAPRKHVES